MNLFDWSNYISEVVGTVLTIVSWKYLTKPFRFLAMHIFLGTICDWTNYFILIRLLHQYNIWLSNLYIFIDVTLVLLAARAMIDHVFVKKSILLVIIAFNIWSIAHYDIHSLIVNDRDYFVGSMFIGVSYFYVLFEKYHSKETSLTKNMIFWLSFVQIVYYLVQIPSLIVKNNTDTSLSFMIIIMNINGVFNTFLYPVTGLIFYYFRRQQIKLLSTTA